MDITPAKINKPLYNKAIPTTGEKMPKTYKTEIIGYAFRELPREVQENVYTRNQEDFCYFQEHVLEDAISEFEANLKEEYGATDVEMFYDISYSQGSGACFTGHFDVDTMLANLDIWQDLCDDLNAEKLSINDIRVERCGPSNYYCHENTCYVVIDWTSLKEYNGDWPDLISNAEKLMTEMVRDQLRDFAYDLRGAYEESISFEAYCEYMSDFDDIACFTEEGEQINQLFLENAHVVDGVQLKLDFEYSDNDADTLETDS